MYKLNRCGESSGTGRGALGDGRFAVETIPDGSTLTPHPSLLLDAPEITIHTEPDEFCKPVRNVYATLTVF